MHMNTRLRTRLILNFVSLVNFTCNLLEFFQLTISNKTLSQKSQFRVTEIDIQCETVQIDLRKSMKVPAIAQNYNMQ